MSAMPDVTLSKRMSWVLRHGASEVGLAMRADGSVLLSDLLSLKNFGGVSRAKVEEIVASDKKTRFSLFTDPETGEWRIRANQGHSLSVVNEEELLREITDPKDIPVCLHGTYKKALDSINRDGLSRMSRRHIHFAADLPANVKSGMRANCDVIVEIDVAKAMADGCRFFRSANDVILSTGFDGGVIPPKYFASVKTLRFSCSFHLSRVCIISCIDSF